MTNLFNQMAEKAGFADTSRYGMSGDMKKTQYVLELIGNPADADTLKCIITAAEQGMEMNCYSVIKDRVDNFNELLQEASPLSITPCLREADFYICGSDAITSFIDARGLGYSLTPRNAMLAAIQNYWVDIAISNVAPEVERIVGEVFSKKYENPSHNSDANIVESCSANLEVYFDALEKQLNGNKYITCNKYTWADVHWTAYVYLCVLSGCSRLVESRKNVAQWWNRVNSRKSQCGQNIVAVDFLPNKEEINQGTLNSVVINDY